MKGSQRYSAGDYVEAALGFAIVAVWAVAVAGFFLGKSYGVRAWVVFFPLAGLLWFVHAGRKATGRTSNTESDDPGSESD